MPKPRSGRLGKQHSLKTGWGRLPGKPAASCGSGRAEAIPVSHEETVSAGALVRGAPGGGTKRTEREQAGIEQIGRTRAVQSDDADEAPQT
ncbi:hypothetical protein [Castellaniella sp.]|uniref:hypothetical protein n=1 Tax=Castellaniella sp. TaxID=1955812 RepID=UPI003C728596